MEAYEWITNSKARLTVCLYVSWLHYLNDLLLLVPLNTLYLRVLLRAKSIYLMIFYFNVI